MTEESPAQPVESRDRNELLTVRLFKKNKNKKKLPLLG